MKIFNTVENTSSGSSLIILDGVKLNNYEQQFCSTQLRKIHKIFPLDTFVELTLSREDSDKFINGSLILTSAEIKFYSQLSGCNILDLFTHMKKEITEQVRKWFKTWPLNPISQKKLESNITVH